MIGVLKFFIFISLCASLSYGFLEELFAQIASQGEEVDLILQGKDSNVKVLDSLGSFESFVSKPETVSAVFFTASWCGPCSMLLQIWSEAAKEVAGAKPGELPIEFSVVDIARNRDIAEKAQISQFPTIKMFLDQEVFSYSSPGNQQVSKTTVVNWINGHTNRRNKILNVDDLNKFLSANNLVILGFFESTKHGQQIDEFVHSSRHFEDVVFAEVDVSLANELAKITGKPAISTFPEIVFVYDHDDKYAVFSDSKSKFEKSHIDKFVRGRRLLSVNVFQPGTIDYILDAGLPMLLMISPNGISEDARNMLKQVADSYLGKVVAVTLGTSLPWETKLAELLGVQDIRFPVVRILTMPEADAHVHDISAQSRAVIQHGLKYKPDEDLEALDAKSISSFVDKYLSGTAKTYLKSEAEPENIRDAYVGGSILINAVGSNFEKFVVDDIKRDILVIYYAAYCGHCTRLAPTIRELGTKLRHLGKTMKIVRIDAHMNEIRNVLVQGYPTIRLYKPSETRVELNQRDQVEYHGDRTLEDFIRFLHENAKHPFDENAPPSLNEDYYMDVQEL